MSRKREPRPIHFVYMLLDADGRAEYVGCSGNVPQRIKSHRAAGRMDRVARVVTDGPYPKGEAYEREASLIGHLRPRLNIVGNPDMQAPNLETMPLAVWADDYAVWHYGLPRYSLAYKDRKWPTASVEVLWQHTPEDRSGPRVERIAPGVIRFVDYPDRTAEGPRANPCGRARSRGWDTRRRLASGPGRAA